MGKTETAQYIIINILFALMFAAFVAGIIVFVIQFRRRKIIHEKEKQVIEEVHQLELLNAKLVSQQQTMQHIGREIHDNVGQKLTLASLYARRLTHTGKADAQVDAIGNIIDTCMAELRMLSKTLSNPQQMDQDIVVLLQNEAVQINASGSCYVTIESNCSTIPVPAEQKNILYRLLQEFIQNSLKHAYCRKININLQLTGRLLTVKAHDDGKGFDTEAPSGGIGLQNMSRRAQELNAVYNLTSSKGKGTVLLLQLPL
jgi:signal transduction histidine kinase